MAGNSTDSGRSVTSKVIAILMTFRSGEAYSLTEIARLTGLPVSTAHRLATELLDWGMLQRTGEGQFRIGTQLRAIADQAATAVPNLHERARRVMEDLAAAAGRAVVRLGVLQRAEIAYLEKEPGDHPVPIAFGSATMPLHPTAMGRALLAFAPPGLVDAVVDRGLCRYTAYTTTDPDQFRHALGGQADPGGRLPAGVRPEVLHRRGAGVRCRRPGRRGLGAEHARRAGPAAGAPAADRRRPLAEP